MNALLKLLLLTGLVYFIPEWNIASAQGRPVDPYQADRVSRQVWVVPEPIVTSVQGRPSELAKVQRAARRCGIKSTNLETMRGPLFFRSPEEPGAELEIDTADLTPAIRRCIGRHSVAWRTAHIRAPEKTK